MALEDMIRKNTPLEGYDRDKFVKYFGAYQDGGEYFQKMASGDVGAKRDLCGLLFSNPGMAETLPTERALDYGSTWLGKEEKATAAYAEHNLDKLLEKLDDKEVYGLAISLAPITGINPDHDNLAGLVKEGLKINQARKMAQEKGSAEGIMAYVNEKAKKFPDWFREAYSDSDAQAFFSTFASYAQSELQKAFTDKNTKKIDRKKAEQFYRENIDKIKEEHDKEPDNKVKQDIMEKEIYPRYIQVAGMVFPKEKKDSKYDKDPAKEDRKTDRKKLGMSN